METKKFLSVILAVAMMLSFANVVFAGSLDGDVVILYTNDVHCAIDNYPTLAAYKAQLESEGNTVITVDAGDAVQGEVIGTMTEGSAIAHIMNAVGYDYAVPGNHEYDYGMERFLELAQNEAEFKYTSSNFYYLPGIDPVFEPYYIEDVNGKQIAFVGITTPESVTKSTPEYFKDENGNFIYGFPTWDMQEGDLTEVVQESVDSAISEGADIVVAVGHMGIEGVTDGWKSTDVIAETTGIDFFIDAHSHEKIVSKACKNKDNENVILTSSGTKLEYFGEITLNNDGSVEFDLIDPDMIQINSMSESAKTEYNKVKTIVDEYNAEIEYLYEVIGTSYANLVAYDEDGNWLVRKSETNMGNFVADAYRAVTGADIAVCNGGGVRAEIGIGNVSRIDLMNINPWNNEMCVIEVTGQQIIDVLEHSVRSYPELSGGFLQVSGVTFEVNAWKQSPVIADIRGNFERIDETMERRVANVKVAGEPIDLQKTYTLAGSAYVLTEGGDGLTMLDGAKVVQSEGLLCDSEMLIKYLEMLGGKITAEQYGNPEGDGRITINEVDPMSACEHNFDRTKSEENLTRPVDGNDGYYTFTCTKLCEKTEVEYVKIADYTGYSEAYDRFNEILETYDFNNTAINYAFAKVDEMTEEYLHDGYLKNNYIESEQYILDGLADKFNELCDELIAGAEDGTFLNADYTEIEAEITALEEWDVEGEFKEVIDDIKAELEALKADDGSTAADVAVLISRIEAIKNCEHICHSDNWFLSFIWDIANFFCCILGLYPVCECGIAHH